MTEKASWQRTYVPETLAPEDVERRIRPWRTGVVAVDLMKGGLSNRNYRLTFRGSDQFVLRFFDRDAACAAREIGVLRAIRHDVPVPEVLYAELNPETGQPFAVLSFVPGISLYTLRMTESPASLGDAVYDAGRLLPRLASHTGPSTPAETLVELMERFTSSAVFAARVPAALRTGIVALVREWQPRVDEVAAVSCLVHGDFNSANILVDRTPAGWRVSGILDWEFALHASPYCDIGNFLRYHRPDRPRYEPEFSRGLRDGGMELPNDWLMLARLMDMPALAELLGRVHVPDDVVAELLLLVEQTVAAGPSLRSG